MLKKLKKRGQMFVTGAKRIVQGDVTKAELSGNIERRQRQVIPQIGIGKANTENFAVGLQRLALNTTGKATPTTKQVMNQRAHAETARRYAATHSVDPRNVTTSGGRQPNPSIRGVIVDRGTQARDGANDFIAGTGEFAGEFVGSALGGISEGVGNAAKGLLSTPAGLLAAGLGGFALIQALSK